jgi:maltose-binding protein MalE
MTKVLIIASVILAAAATVHATVPQPNSSIAIAAKIDIKIKNDTNDEVTVYNAGSGGTYRLQKNVVTTIKMEEGDKLYIYEKGKKGRQLLVASADLKGKVQLFSKL